MNQYSECFYCGQSYHQFKESGRLNCNNCYKVFYSESKEYSKVIFSTHEIFKKKIPKNIPIAENLEIRYRIARNFKGTKFDELNRSEIKEKLDEILKSKQPIPELEFIFLDEDQLRIIGFPKNFMELRSMVKVTNQFSSKKDFVYDKQKGFLTACPTNSGRGNKVSVRFSFLLKSKKTLTEILSYKFGYRLSPRYPEIGKEVELILYIKNPNYHQTIKFLKICSYIIDSIK
ncbi:MAG: hypothetical protein SFU98_14245 [Leptospiraceae bacterium]|nr:hypothetical protein [Leptospiraceae bacterium]